MGDEQKQEKDNSSITNLICFSKKGREAGGKLIKKSNQILTRRTFCSSFCHERQKHESIFDQRADR